MQDANKTTGIQLKLDSWLTTRKPEKNWKARRKQTKSDENSLTSSKSANNNLGGDRDLTGVRKAP